MTIATSSGSRAWLPNVDYLIGTETRTVAYCFYCFHQTEWMCYLRARREILRHLDGEHQDRKAAA